MPYYVPQKEAAATAAFARSLMGLGAVPFPHRNAFIYSRPNSASIAVRAAQSAALFPHRSQKAGTAGTAVMSGMGLGILPTVNVRYAKTAIPAAMAHRRREAIRLRRRSMSGLGKGHGGGGPILAGKAHAAMVAPIMGIRHQPGFFMGPGGGPGGGPFHFPGFTMSGMGLSDDGSIDTTMIPSGDTLTPPTVTDITNPYAGLQPSFQFPTITPIDTTMMDSGGTLISPTSPTQAPSPFSTLQPSVPANLFQQIGSGIASIFGGSGASRPAGAGAQPSASMNVSGVLPIILVGALGFGLVKSLVGKKRR